MALTFPAFAQIDGAAFARGLRAKYGPPLSRETFLVPAGEMVVDYAQSGHVCRIELPPVGPDAQQPGVKSAKAVDEFLLKLLPLDVRGKELQKRFDAMGASSESVVEYENVIIAESMQGKRRTGVTVSFKNEDCRKPSR